jgi:hypothetical protein
MNPEKKDRGPRQEYEVAYYTKELGRSLQRKMLRERLEDLNDPRADLPAHGEGAHPDPEQASPPAQDERAG